MKKYCYIPLVLLFIFVLSGCAIGVHTSPASISVPGEFKKNTTVAILISDQDLQRKERVSFGMVEWIFPWEIAVGDMLKSSAANCFAELFNEVSFEPSGAGNKVTLKIEDFSMSSLSGKAHLQLMATIQDESGNTIMNNNYSADGSGHAPIYWSDLDKSEHVSKTTQEAFQAVFSQIANDVKGVTFN